MIKKLIIQLALLMLCFNLIGCAGLPADHFTPIPGQMYGLQPGSTMYGIRETLRNEIMNRVYFDGTSKFIFLWIFGGDYNSKAWAFVCYDVASKTFVQTMQEMAELRGQVIHQADASTIFGDLVKKGWKVIPAAEVEATIIAAASLTTQAIIDKAAQIGMIFFIPLTPDFFEYPGAPEDL